MNVKYVVRVVSTILILSCLTACVIASDEMEIHLNELDELRAIATVAQQNLLVSQNSLNGRLAINKQLQLVEVNKIRSELKVEDVDLREHLNIFMLVMLLTVITSGILFIATLFRQVFRKAYYESQVKAKDSYQAQLMDDISKLETQVQKRYSR